MAEQRRDTVLAFKGIRQDAEPHITNANNNDGQANLTDGRNVRTQTGAIQTRPGVSFVRRWAHDTWPLHLFNRRWPGPKQTSGDDREDNDGLTAATDAVPSLMQPLSGSAETSLSAYWRSGQARPDYTMLGARLFLANGRDAPLAVDKERNVRPMGTQGQRQDLTLTEKSTGALEPGQAYFYVVQRVLKRGDLEVPSPGISKSITLSSDGTSVTVGNIIKYEYTAPPGYEVRYRIYRTTVDTTQAAYLVVDRAQSDFPSWPGEYLDEKSDADLDMTQSYSLVTTSGDYPVPACSFIRAHMGRLVAAGSRPYTGTADTTIDSNQVAVNSGIVREADIGANMEIAGETATFRITDVDTVGGTWTVEPAPQNDATGADFVLQHARDIIYQTNIMPGNIEGYEPGTELYSNAESGNPITGLAVAGGVCYVLRATCVQLLEGAGGQAQLVPVPNLPPGCTAAATISDRYAQRVFYYAGRAGVWQIAGNEAQDLSAPIRRILEQEVDHTYDAWTHAVYDPVEKLYHLWLFQANDVSSESSLSYRVPSLLLTYDLRRGEWYRGELAASASGVWLDNADNPYPVAGVLNGVVRLDTGTVDGSVGIRTTISSVSGTSITLNTTTSAPLEGMPLTVQHADRSTEYRTIVNKVSSSEVEVHKSFDSAAADETCVVGGIRWMAEIGELELAPAVEHTKKFQALDVIHAPVAENMTIELTGLREFADRLRMREVDMTGESRQKMAAADMGLRGRSCVVQLRGVSTNEVKILALTLESTDVKQ